MAEAKSILKQLFEIISSALKPIADVVSQSGEDPLHVILFLREYGWDIPIDSSFTGDGSSLNVAVSNLDDLLNGNELSLNELLGAIRAINDTLDSLAIDFGLDLNSQLNDALSQVLPTQLIDHALISYLEDEQPNLVAVLAGLGVIVVSQHEPTGAFRIPYLRKEIRWGVIKNLLQDPARVQEYAYGWGTTEYDGAYLLDTLEFALSAVGISVGRFEPTDDIDPPSRVVGEPVYVDIITWPDFSIGLEIYQVGDQNVEDAGLAIAPYINGHVHQDVEIGPSLSLRLEGGLELERGFGIELRQDTGIELFGLNALPSPAGYIKVRLDFMPMDGLFRVGRLDGNLFELSGLAFALWTELKGGEVDYGIEVGLQCLHLILSTEEGDSFLNKLISRVSVDSEVDLFLGAGLSRGLYLQSSGAFEITIPVHRAIGPVQIQAIFISIGIEDDILAVRFAASIGASLGPISAAVEKLGLRLDVDLTGGNLGPVNLDTGFLPPTGAGLAVSAGPVIGGGYLEFDSDNQRYAGILQLQAGEIGLVAIGLITTRMPGGKDGFSLLINIGVEFMPPIQLPYGFTLSGVGGLLGYNRTMNTEALREGLRNRALDSILFPEDPIANAPKIISDLRAVFPPEEFRFVIGPMVKLGWGTPQNIIQADIGIFIELPMPVRIALLGQIAAGLPLPEKAIIELHIDVLGIIEFDKQLLSIDATIYDSRIYEYTLTGDAAVRLAWGDNPVLAMSLGGFHPRFSPPSGFPSLGRLTLNLSQGRDLQLYCKTYQALTSNSLQFGALVVLYAKQSGATVEGNLSFDTLIYFSPFSFAVVLAGNVLAKYKGRQLANVHINMQLTGPTPWNARGSASFEILFWDITVKFNKSWGPTERIVMEAIDPWLGPDGLKEAPDGLKEALEHNESWGARLPGRSGMVEVLASRAEEEDSSLIVHPAGMLEVRQNRVPLKMALQKLGNAPVKDRNYFEILTIIIDEQTLDHIDIIDIEDYFARAQFLNLSDNERLSLPSFEEMPSGVAVGSEDIAFDGQVTFREHKFESILIQEDRTSREAVYKDKATLPWRTASRHLGGCSARRCDIRMTARHKFETLGKAKQVSVVRQGHQIIDTDDLSVVAEISGNDGTMGRLQAEQALAVYCTANPAMASHLEMVPAYEVAT